MSPLPLIASRITSACVGTGVGVGVSSTSNVGTGVRGTAFGMAGTVGLSIMLDMLDERLARDFDSSVGVNHTYIFGEFNFQEMFRSSTVPLLLSSRHWLFGLAFDL